MEKLTPLMQQYWAIKAAHPHELLFFRMGDFYELFHEDARIAAPILNIALTARNKKNSDETAMCGVPYHSVAGPINKLLKSGYRVAICDQMEDPAQAKGIVKRAVTRILSPGMVYDPETLEGHCPNYICSFDSETMSFLDATTGDAFYFVLTPNSKDKERLLSLLSPVEIVLPAHEKIENSTAPITPFDIKDLEFLNEPPWNLLPLSAKRLLAYASYMQGPQILKSIQKFELRLLAQHLELSPTVLRHLEIFSTYDGSEEASLFKTIDRTQTSCGARLLRSWLRFPLVDPNQIQCRADRVEKWFNKMNSLKQLREGLASVGDLERRLGKITNPGCSPRDVLSLAHSLKATNEVAQNSEGEINLSLSQVAAAMANEIFVALVDDPPIQLAKGGVFKKGYRLELDELIRLTDETERCIFEIEVREKERTQIPSLKVRFNNVFGYYIEITKTHLQKVPSDYVRRQTLATGERFVTEELRTLEEKILTARSKRLELEALLFAELKAKILEHLPELLNLARQIAELDAILALAFLAVEQNYVRPTITDKASALKLLGSRHPVVEQTHKKTFIANDIELGLGQCMLLTGPNMAGKSTLMRQVAVAVVLAQMGSFVPAKKASLPIFHKIFTRIGASDSLAQGLSTFMVEMSETAEMLQMADAKTLVILDEIGRGTSTYDGLSLAQAILEHLIEKSKALIFFATHYHELTQLAQAYLEIKNFHMGIYEDKGEIRFLYSLRKGPANKSYGIEVARLAGLPSSVIFRARNLLKGLEKTLSQSQLKFSAFESSVEALNPLLEEIKNLNIQTMTPLEALNKISHWQGQIN